MNLHGDLRDGQAVEGVAAAVRTLYRRGAGALSAAVVASPPAPASLPPEPDPLEPPLELPPELLLPVDPPLDPLDPLLEPELDPPSKEEPPSSDGAACPPPPLPQPAATANATQGDRARVDRRTAARTDERIAPLLMVGSLRST